MKSKIKHFILVCLKIVFKFSMRTKKLYKKLNIKGKVIFVLAGLILLACIVLILKTLFYPSIYGSYRIQSLNGAAFPSPYSITISKDKISGTICGDWEGKLVTKSETLSSGIIIKQSICDQYGLSLQYSIMYGLQSGLTYSLSKNILTLTDKSRNNIFILTKEK